MGEKLRILVIDDSSYNRQAISAILNSHPDMEVVATAVDGEQGLKLVSHYKPDLITLDIEMPRMDGFTFLRLLMSQMPTPVIMVSSHSRKQEVFQALELGALDFIAKPSRFFETEASPVRKELLDKALAVRTLQIVPLSRRASHREVTQPPPALAGAQVSQRKLEKLVLVGASTGGPPALQSMLKALGDIGGSAILVAQHMPEKFTRAFAERLNRMTQVTVKEAVEREVVTPGHVYVAAGGTHLEVEMEGGQLWTRISPRGQDDGYIPSIDRLFISAARQFRGELMAVVMTGMGTDGAEGIRAVQAAGGDTLAESRETAIVYGMPKSAVSTGCVNHELPLDGLIATVHAFTRAGS